MLNSPPLRIALTGGSGFLGSHLVPMLLQENYSVSCLNRKSSRRKIFPPSVRLVEGDCTDSETMRDLLSGQNVLVHMASTLFAANWQSYLESNTRFAHSVVAAYNALDPASRPEKVVFVSSLAAAGPCATSPGLDENCVPRPVSAYGWSKLMAERILLEAFGNKLVIMRPPIIYGSGDRGLLPMFKSAARGLGISPGLRRDFPVSAIHADDVARAIVLMVKQDASGIYHLNDGHEYSMADFCAAMGKACGREETRILRMPLPIMGVSAALCSGWANAVQSLAKYMGKSMAVPQWNMDKYREARQTGWLADATLIGREHGFVPLIDLEHGMAEAVAGYCKAGQL